MVIMALTLLCGVIGTGGLAFITIGWYTALRETLAPWSAGFIVGGVMLVAAIAGVLAIWYSVRNKRGHSGTPAPESTSRSAQLDAVTHLGKTIGSSMNQRDVRTTDVMIAALVAGTVLGASPALREQLFRHRGRERNNGNSYPEQSGQRR